MTTTTNAPSQGKPDPTLARRLTRAEQDYVVSHLAQHVATSRPLSQVLAYDDAPPRPGTVAITPSDRPLDTKASIDGLPLLFPTADTTAPFDRPDGAARFNFDVLKAAFFLLSAYQEHASAERDQWGRFPYASSLQARMGFVGVPLVNHYFRWLVQSIVCVASQSGFEAHEVSPLGGPSLYLTHDVDLAHYLTWRKTLFRFAQVVGLRRCDTSRKRLLAAAMRSLAHMTHLARTADPYWSFDKMADTEAYMGFTSTYFLLPDDGGPFPPDYSLSADPDIVALRRRLVALGHTVGLHAPIRCQTAHDYAAHLARIPEAAPHCRQHFLAVSQPDSLRGMAEAGIRLDASLGFSEHEGFRNSYCHPFHPFDHVAQKALPIVEVPLAVMDVTILRHRALSYDEAFLAVGDLLDQVRLFGGVFCLLWHNSSFDETYNPGVGRFYDDLMLMLAQYQLRQLDAAALTAQRVLP